MLNPQLYKQNPINASNGLLDNSAQQIMCLKDGRMVITTIGNINIYDGARFSYIASQNNKKYTLKDYRGNYHVYIDRHNYLWLKDTYSLCCVNMQTEKYEYVPNVLKKLGVKKNITDLFVTEQGRLWLVYNSNILYGLDSKIKIRIPNNNGQIQDISVYNEKFLMIFYSNGRLICYDLDTLKQFYTTIPDGKNNQKKYNTSSVIKRLHNTYYQIRNGEKESILMSFDINSHKWNTILKTPFHLNNLVFDRADILYISCEYGYYTYNYKTGSIQHIKNLKIDNGMIVNTDINIICFDHQGGMWIGTEKRGIIYGRPIASPFYILQWDNPLSVKLDNKLNNTVVEKKYKSKIYHCVFHDGIYTWVGSDSGLLLFKNNKLFHHITIKDGLPNNIIHSIIKDMDGNIWVATSYGVASVRLYKNSNKFIVHNYVGSDGIAMNQYLSFKSILLPNGNIAIKGVDNIILFNPREVLAMVGSACSVHNRLNPVLISLFVMGTNVAVGEQYGSHVILDKALSHTEQFSLNYDQNNITFIVSSLNYFRPNDTYFRYRLLGSDDKSWHYINSFSFEGRSAKDGEVSISFNSLTPGSYSLEIQASTMKYIWKGKSKIIKFDIRQPWWRSTGLQILLTILLLAVFLYNLKLYSSIIRLKGKREHADDKLIIRLRNYVNNCKSMSGSILSPSQSSATGKNINADFNISKKEMMFMRKIINVSTTNNMENYNIKQLCEDASITREEVYKYSKLVLSKPMRRMTTVLRLNDAVRLLIETNHSVEEISDIVRFVNVAYFYEMFNNEFHCTPEEYRERNKK